MQSRIHGKLALGILYTHLISLASLYFSQFPLWEFLTKNKRIFCLGIACIPKTILQNLKSLLKINK